MKRFWPLGLIMLTFLVFACLMNQSTPYRQAGRLIFQNATVQDVGAPDERQHANYIHYVMDGYGFPVLRPGSADLYETYQSHQPPLFYLLEAGWCRITGADPTLASDGFRVRLLNALFGLLTIAGVYWLARWAFDPDERAEQISLCAAAIAGLMPMFVALNSAVSNDPLLISLCTWCLALLVRLVMQGCELKPMLWLGVLLGLALLTKTTALALIPVVALAGWRGTRTDPTSFNLKSAGVVVIIGLLIVTPWWIRNQMLYGDPLALKAFKDAFVGTAMREQMVQMVAAMREARGLDPGGAGADYAVNWFGWWTLRSFYGVFSQMDIFMPANLYRGLGLMSLVGLGAYGMGWRNGPKHPGSRTVHLLLATFLGFIVLLFIQFNLTYFQAQARYLYPAISVIAIGFALGLARVRHNIVFWTIFAGLTALNIYVAAWLPGEFARRITG